MSISRPSATALAAAGLAGALVLGLSACTPEPAPTPSSTAEPSASDAPIFASDEEALAAAVKAYEAYDNMSDLIINDGGERPDRIDALVTEEYAPRLHDEFAAFAEAGLRVEGDSILDTTSLVSRTETDQIAKVSIYFCRDVSDVRVVDKAGEDVTPGGRQDRIPSQGFFVSGAPGSNELVVDEVTKWSGEDFC